jgi:hypothetical protein
MQIAIPSFNSSYGRAGNILNDAIEMLLEFRAAIVGLETKPTSGNRNPLIVLNLSDKESKETKGCAQGDCRHRPGIAELARQCART